MSDDERWTDEERARLEFNVRREIALYGNAYVDAATGALLPRAELTPADVSRGPVRPMWIIDCNRS